MTKFYCFYGQSYSNYALGVITMNKTSKKIKVQYTFIFKNSKKINFSFLFDIILMFPA